MIQGHIINMKAVVGVTFRLPGNPDFELEFVIDTGFAGALTLPANVVAALGLPFFTDDTVNLADDSEVTTDIHTAAIVWDGIEYDAPIYAMGKRPLLGMLLLKGYHLDANFEEGRPFILTKI